MNCVDIDENHENTLIDVNEIKTKPASLFIAAIEHNQAIRNSWYEKQSMGEKYDSWSDSSKKIQPLSISLSPVNSERMTPSH